VGAGGCAGAAGICFHVKLFTFFYLSGVPLFFFFTLIPPVVVLCRPFCFARHAGPLFWGGLNAPWLVLFVAQQGVLLWFG